MLTLQRIHDLRVEIAHHASDRADHGGAIDRWKRLENVVRKAAEFSRPSENKRDQVPGIIKWKSDRNRAGIARRGCILRRRPNDFRTRVTWQACVERQNVAHDDVDRRM